ncbi:hypothetical protein K491DRAFT_101785 [Lophiostoma macrostomum CBS 122681]|uniref:Uncharacterized protein n=1 Tax=Lophiostoma macrostomum CBS 122681 TaxID=1314788 RepID=A0A6A6SYA6_9PLEO|nr:hypothetical protein K491DRAFT_101785 [Lophiostoma macrostomum CBS 122681]
MRRTLKQALAGRGLSACVLGMVRVGGLEACPAQRQKDVDPCPGRLFWGTAAADCASERATTTIAEGWRARVPGEPCEPSSRCCECQCQCQCQCQLTQTEGSAICLSTQSLRGLPAAGLAPAESWMRVDSWRSHHSRSSRMTGETAPAAWAVAFTGASHLHHNPPSMPLNGGSASPPKQANLGRWRPYCRPPRTHTPAVAAPASHRSRGRRVAAFALHLVLR